MATSYGFHPEALFEYAEATHYYLQVASPDVAEAFVTTVESAIVSILENPDRYRVVEPPEIRRYVFKRFPFVIYYQWDSQLEQVGIQAVMHCSREPGYWHGRVGR